MNEEHRRKATELSEKLAGGGQLREPKPPEEARREREVEERRRRQEAALKAEARGQPTEQRAPVTTSARWNTRQRVALVVGLAVALFGVWMFLSPYTPEVGPEPRMGACEPVLFELLDSYDATDPCDSSPAKREAVKGRAFQAGALIALAALGTSVAHRLLRTEQRNT